MNFNRTMFRSITLPSSLASFRMEVSSESEAGRTVGHISLHPGRKTRVSVLCSDSKIKAAAGSQRGKLTTISCLMMSQACQRQVSSYLSGGSELLSASSSPPAAAGSTPPPHLSW